MALPVGWLTSGAVIPDNHYYVTVVGSLIISQDKDNLLNKRYAYFKLTLK